MGINNAIDRVSAEALSSLLEECEVAIEALERAEAWSSAARLKQKLRWYQEVQKSASHARPSDQPYMSQPVLFPRIEFNGNIHDLGRMTVTMKCGVCWEIMSAWTDGTIRHWPHEACPQQSIRFRVGPDTHGFVKFDVTEGQPLLVPDVLVEAVPEAVL